ncbi:MAG TPA: YsnF/AvaK domain-containing protein [Thermomicrobiaceae bacterium]|nr:YsnF/AvaK domain-containing protein [Thermomicrobiaceae bacterium]
MTSPSLGSEDTIEQTGPIPAGIGDLPVSRYDAIDADAIRVHTVIEEVPGHLEVSQEHDEVIVRHVPVGREVAERAAPREEGDTLIVPVYAEQLVVSRRIVLVEQLRIRRRRTAQCRLIEDTLQQDRVIVEDPGGTGRVREQFPTAEVGTERPARGMARATEEGSLAELLRRLRG